MAALINPATIRALREARGWSQKFLAARAGIGETTIKEMERGVALRQSRNDTPRKIAEALGVSIADLAEPIQGKEVIMADGEFVPVRFLVVRRETHGSKSALKVVDTNTEDPREGDEFVPLAETEPAVLFQMSDPENRGGGNIPSPAAKARLRRRKAQVEGRRLRKEAD